MSRPPLWYRLASYLLEIPVEKRSSPLSGDLAVTYHRGQYKLSTRNAVYSFGKHYTSFAIPFRELGLADKPFTSVLVLGFGLGSVVDLLGRHPHIRRILAVDADAVILELAQKYLEAPLLDRIEFRCADATTFLSEQTERFDLVLFDVFVDDRTPPPLQQTAVLEALKRTLAPDGWLLYSKLDTDRLQKAENEQFEKRFRAVFPQAFSVDAEGNRIFIARG